MTTNLNPFVGLLNLKPRRQPAVGQVQMVVAGKRVDGKLASDVSSHNTMDEAEIAKLKRDRRLAAYRNSYQRIKSDPERLAKRKAKEAEKADARREYQAQYRAANAERIKEQKRAYAARKAASRTDAERQKRAEARMAHYYRTHERQLEIMQEYRAKRKALREQQKGIES